MMLFVPKIVWKSILVSREHVVKDAALLINVCMRYINSWSVMFEWRPMM